MISIASPVFRMTKQCKLSANYTLLCSQVHIQSRAKIANSLYCFIILNSGLGLTLTSPQRPVGKQRPDRGAPRVVSSIESDKIILDQSAQDQLFTLFQQFERISSSNKDEGLIYKQRMQAMYDTYGFTVERKSSNLTDGGRGVFVTTGRAKQGSIVSMYPGVVYQPWEPVFFVSLGNPFLFRCQDGVHIDGKDTGLSKMMYKSCSKRDRELGEYTCDTSWLTEYVLNPLAVGQYVNNQTREYQANVAYQEFDIPDTFPQQYRKYIPNIEAKLDREMEAYMRHKLLRTVLLVAVRDIEHGEELFSTYYTIVHTGQGEGSNNT